MSRNKIIDQSCGEDILRDAADRASTFDPELERTLRDMAAEYAGPYIDPTPVNPQVSDEEWQRQQEMA